LDANAQPNGRWGDTKGQDYSQRNYRSFRVFARGSSGGRFPRIQFKLGDSTAPQSKYSASYSLAYPTVELSSGWQEFCFDLNGKDLSNVLSPLTIVITRGNNPSGAVFYIDTMHFSHDPCPAGGQNNH
jgi:hypothetical protein